ncbi:hypothetical protein [Phaeodactylibacter xiamenensis]|uniref:hypothetical protein n=1 Tax=Phaeodactylibacter xiamenensis TaxID=1524460 RepID=UPI003BAC4A1B
MNKYLLAYIDEEAEDREAFELYFDEYENEFEVKFIEPGGKTMSQIIDEIIDLKPDMVIVDYYLKNKDATVLENGDALMQRITDRKPLLPVVMLTSFMKNAARSFLPPEKRKSILEKSLLNDVGDTELKNEVVDYIMYYRDLVQKYKEEFAGLQEKAEKSEDEKARMIELDMILEEAVDRQSAIKSEHKTDEKLGALKTLITETKELLKEFKKDPDA